MNRSAALSRMLYPTYAINGEVATLTAAPVFKVQFGNLIVDASTGGPLFGIIKGYSFAPALEAGFFTDKSSTSGDHGGTATLIPKVFKVSFDLNVLHSHAMGYNEKGKFRGNDKSYPYTGARIQPKTKLSQPGKKADKLASQGQNIAENLAKSGEGGIVRVNREKGTIDISKAKAAAAMSSLGEGFSNAMTADGE